MLRCPACAGTLRDEPGALRCTGCATGYPVTPEQVDLRPQRRLTRAVRLDVAPPSSRSTPPWPSPLGLGPYPRIAYDESDGYLSYGNRLTPTLTTHIPTPNGDDELLLDVGSGPGTLGRLLAAARGLSYLGIDYDYPGSEVLGDAEALPVRDGAASVATSFVVLEHVRSPAAVVQEMARCLRPGGVLVGTVAFLEPFHMNSYFHHTHLGLRTVLEDAGLLVTGLEANDRWLGPQAIRDMTGGNRVRRLALRSAAGLAHVGSRRSSDAEYLATVTAGFRFVAVKPAAPPQPTGA